MDIKLIVTKTCSHCNNLKREFEDLGLNYELCYVEDNPDLVTEYRIRHSPNVMVNNEIVCRGMVSEGELKKLFNL